MPHTKELMGKVLVISGISEVEAGAIIIFIGRNAKSVSKLLSVSVHHIW